MRGHRTAANNPYRYRCTARVTATSTGTGTVGTGTVGTGTVGTGTVGTGTVEGLTGQHWDTHQDVQPA